MFENIRQRWTDSGSGARAGFLIGVLAILLLFAGLIYWAMRDTYQVLFSDLDPQDATTIISELDKMKVPYRLEEGGKVILVAEESVYKTRLKLMGKGVNLRGTVGFEIFNTTDFGTTEFAQKINYQRALQGELARTIMDFEEIKFARVHLVMPESGLFKKSNVKPKASISLIMKGDRALSAEQVAGIQRLVAASVPEIDPAAVTVLDQRGVALSRKLDTEGEADMSNGRLEVKKQVEGYLTRKIADMLDKVVGAGQAIVSVDAMLTQDHVKITREDVIPLSSRGGEAAGSIVRRRQSGSSQSSVDDVAVLPLTETDGAASLPKRDAPRGQNRTLEVEYQNGRKIEQSVSTPGNIKRISVGVLLPNTVSAEQLEKIREVVAMAAGITSARGDSLAIYSIEQFAAKAQQPAPVALAEPRADGQAAGHADDDGSAAIIRSIVMLLGAAGLLGAGFLVMRRPGKSAQPLLASATMTEAERLEALTHMRQWLNGDSHGLKAEVQR